MCRASCGAQPEIGAEHLNTQIAEGNLDGCLSKQGENAEAVHLQREVLAAQELPRGRALQHADDRQQSLWIMGRRTRRRKSSGAAGVVYLECAGDQRLSDCTPQGSCGVAAETTGRAFAA